MTSLRIIIAALAASLMLEIPASAQEGSDLYLRCSWSSSDGRTGSDLFKVGGGQFSKFFPNESHWSSMCFASNSQVTSACSLTEDQFFVRVTSGNGSSTMTEQYVINRHTGTYSYSSSFVTAYSEQSGVCNLSAPPSLPARRF